MDRKENIRNAYRLTGSNNFYDGMITCSTVSGKAVCRLVWDMGKEECDEYLNKAFTGVENANFEAYFGMTDTKKIILRVERRSKLC